MSIHRYSRYPSLPVSYNVTTFQQFDIPPHVLLKLEYQGLWNSQIDLPKAQPISDVSLWGFSAM
jgi:hypothetical protein